MHTDVIPPPADPDAIRTALQDAMVVGCLAPSIFNSQPWRWVVAEGELTLYADTTKQITAIDPDMRLLHLSCGASLHHAYTELAALGYRAEIDRLPDPDQPSLLARITVEEACPPDPDAELRARAAWARHTDRRPFALGSSVNADDIAELRRAGQIEGIVVHDITAHSAYLATAASAAAGIEARSEAYQAALVSWVEREGRSDDGVPLATIAPSLSRPVGLRDFGVESPGGLLEIVAGDDAGASFLAVGSFQDTPDRWLAAGESTSAILLTATRLRLGTSPMSDVVEVPGARALIRSLLPDRAIPQLVIRVGVPATDISAPTSPRRIPDQIE